MAKKTIKLTESELHNLIKESVKKVLEEGQGLDTFKKGFIDNDLSDDIYEKGDGKQKIRNFIDTGDIEGRNFRYYHPNNPTVATTYKDGAKEIDRSTMGKIGRAAGFAGGMGAKLAKKGAQKLKQGASAVGEKASDFARNAKSRMIKNKINRQSRNHKNNGNGDYDSFTL